MERLVGNNAMAGVSGALLCTSIPLHDCLPPHGRGQLSPLRCQDPTAGRDLGLVVRLRTVRPGRLRNVRLTTIRLQRRKSRRIASFARTGGEFWLFGRRLRPGASGLVGQDQIKERGVLGAITTIGGGHRGPGDTGFGVSAWATGTAAPAPRVIRIPNDSAPSTTTSTDAMRPVTLPAVPAIRMLPHRRRSIANRIGDTPVENTHSSTANRPARPVAGNGFSGSGGSGGSGCQRMTTCPSLTVVSIERCTGSVREPAWPTPYHETVHDDLAVTV